MLEGPLTKGPRAERVVAGELTVKALYKIIYDRLDYIRPEVQTDIDAVTQNAVVMILAKVDAARAAVPDASETSRQDEAPKLYCTWPEQGCYYIPNEICPHCSTIPPSRETTRELSEAELDAIDARARVATPGPWQSAESPWRGTADVFLEDGLVIATLNSAKNAAHIAGLDPQTVRALVAQARSKK